MKVAYRRILKTSNMKIWIDNVSEKVSVNEWRHRKAFMEQKKKKTNSWSGVSEKSGRKKLNEWMLVSETNIVEVYIYILFVTHTYTVPL